MDFSTKNVVVTGGRQGIGKAIATAFAKAGANIAIIEKSEDKNNKLKEEFSSYPAKFIYISPLDVSDYNAVIESFSRIAEELGSVDILVNNAGITRDNLLIRMEEKNWDDVINTNLKGTFNCCKAAIPVMMKKRYGKVINIASVIGEIGNAGQINYAASKAGIIGLTKSLAKEVARRNITVNAIAPGFIETDMTKGLPESVVESYLKSIPKRKLGKPEDIANAVLFLASEAANYITGQVINVDGGLVM
ncbi:MAG: 3-oxoacyl-[acyl-carrier-protein] reductase [Proteobacteria bacterium]|nr:3-oxoacyl-[acyl-carrier-protein] reductase [Pseudomonadota bacterium]